MGRVRRWLYLGLGMLAWRAGKYYVRRRMRRRGTTAAADPPPPG